MAISSVKKTGPHKPDPTLQSCQALRGAKTQVIWKKLPKFKGRFTTNLEWTEANQKPCGFDSLYIRPTYYLLGKDFAAHDIVDAIGDWRLTTDRCLLFVTDVLPRIIPMVLKAVVGHMNQR